MPEGKFFMVRSRMTGMVVDLQDSIIEADQPVVMHSSHGGSNQLWYEDRNNNVIRSMLDDSYVLEVKGDNLVINAFEPDEYNQHWKCAGDHIEHTDDPSKALDIVAFNKEDGAEIHSWDFASTENQLFDFEYVPRKFCFIRSKMNGKVFDVVKGDRSPGTKVVMHDKHDPTEDWQLWWEDKYGNIRSKLNDYVLDSTEGSVRLQEYEPDIPGRKWVKNGQKISNKDDPGDVIDIRGADDSNGARLVQYAYEASDNQHFAFDYV